MNNIRNMPSKQFLLFIFMLFVILTPLFSQNSMAPIAGDTDIDKVCECTSIRNELWDSIISKPPKKNQKAKILYKENDWGKWTVTTTEIKNDSSIVMISPQRNNSYSSYTQGTWIISKSMRTGEFTQAIIYLRSDPGTFARIYPFGTRSRIDIIIYGGVLYREIIIPLSFEDVVKSDFSKIRKLTKDIVNWNMFSPDIALYRGETSFIARIRNKLHEIRYKDDGAIDFDGRSVYISNLKEQSSPTGLNCSGFSKWLVDGILYPMTGRYLRIDDLKERMIDWRGSSFTIKYEESEDPFFGLDWSRALAKATWSIFYPGRSDDSPLSEDVNDAPFAVYVENPNPLERKLEYKFFADNFDDAGIDIHGLKTMLYKKAIDEPGHFYLAQFNTRSNTGSHLRKYFHIAALFPFFDEKGIFRIVVFESAEETSFDSILKRNYEYVKLIRMPISTVFDPPSLKD